ncbi:TetR/AcrR family transcriptional regulator [Lucifera butyrica]|uniref:TetR/AcrR family transcriptional regulator n=1 Tax=Lucifera butyrica TaxID=1351585 RepID=UPI000F029C16|nr:TetR/AcrR family transcriptional regulator [Lucifera butyrica]
MDDLKNDILDKAKERFDRFGYKKTTMDEISRDCRISKKTVYEQFKDKEDLFTCLIIREKRKARDIIFASIREINDPLDKLLQMMRTAIGYFNEDNFLTRLLKDDEILFSNFLSTKSHSLIRDELIAMIADIIVEGKKQGKIRDVDEQFVAYAGLKLFEAFSYMRTIELDRNKAAQGYYTEALVDFIVHALIKK